MFVTLVAMFAALVVVTLAFACPVVAMFVVFALISAPLAAGKSAAAIPETIRILAALVAPVVAIFVVLVAMLAALAVVTLAFACPVEAMFVTLVAMLLVLVAIFAALVVVTLAFACPVEAMLVVFVSILAPLAAVKAIVCTTPSGNLGPPLKSYQYQQHLIYNRVKPYQYRSYHFQRLFLLG